MTLRPTSDVNLVVLTRRVREVSGLTHEEAKNAVNATFDVMAEALRKGETINISRFAKFWVETTKPVRRFSVLHGEYRMAPSFRKVRVKVGAELKKIVRGSSE